MVRIHGTYEYDDDDLTPGKNKAGGLHQNLFDGNGKLKGSARFTPDDEQSYADDELSVVYIDNSPAPKSAAQVALEREIQERIGLLIDSVFAMAKPHVKKFYNDKARPALRAKWENRPRRSKNKNQLPASGPMSIAEMRVAISEEVEEASAEYRQNMSSSEAQARIVMAMFLRGLSDDQLAMVANADVALDEGYDELERKLSELTPQQVTYMIESLMADPSLVAEQLLGFERLLGLAPPDAEPRPTQER